MGREGSNGRHGGTLDLATRELGVSPGSGKKRKGRDVFAPARPDPDPISAPEILLSETESTATRQPQQIQAAGGVGGRKLLAGYLAHEFLIKGTLFGHHWDSSAAAMPLSARERHPPPPLPYPRHQQEEEWKAAKDKNHAYAEVAYLLKAEGPGIPGVVNPTQLLRWLQM